MTRPRLTVAEVIESCRDEFLERYGSSLLPEHHRVLEDLTTCRTAALGGHVLGCPDCGHQQIAYNSCGNRHCPTCQASAAARWLEAQAADLLSVPYFHIVFTLPNALDPLARSNPRLVYDLLLRCAAEAVLALAANPERLGAQTGVLAVLHTWGQNLQFHPHVHCVVPGGGLAPDRTRWIASNPKFFLPVRALSAVFRGKFLEALRAAYRAGKLRLPGQRAGSVPRTNFAKLLTLATRTPWVVYAKAPFGGPVQVLKYLARYTHRIAISNNRLLDLTDGVVRFRYKDYRHRGRKRTIELRSVEFVRRFLLHVLPPRFVRIRRYGILSNGHRQEMLSLCRGLLTPESPGEGKQSAPESSELEAPPRSESSAVTPTRICPVCGAARLIVIAEFPPLPTDVPVCAPAHRAMLVDSS
jgi:hypothetical protein